ncbi:MAG: hypothetical protein MI745_14075 [Pseudomonadales bacterium]|nr:hypothetical protein [Pseudomonadales bacterium]
MDNDANDNVDNAPAASAEPEGAQVEVKVSDATGTLNVDENAFDKFLDGRSDSYKEMLQKNNVDSFEKHEKWVEGLNSLIGKKGLIDPGEGATEEAKEEYREKLLDAIGRPEDGKYEFDLPDGSKDDYYTDDFLDAIAGVAHKYGMSSEGFQELINTIAMPFNELMGEWERQIGDIEKRVAAATQPDGVSDAPSPAESVNMAEKAREMAAEARRLHSAGQYKQAQAKHAEAQRLYGLAAQG